MSDKDSFEEQNITNLIEFYKAELKLVLEGASIDGIFTKVELRRLRGKGVLDFSHPSWFITDKAKEILCL